MTKIKYACSRGHNFVGDDYTQECPECGSSELTRGGGGSSLGEGPFQYFKENKLLTWALAAVFVIIIIFLIRGCPHPPPPSDEYTIEYRPDTNFIEINIVKNSIINDKRKTERPDFSKIASGFKFSFSDGNVITFEDGNRIYPCTSGFISIKCESSLYVIKKGTESFTYDVKLPKSGTHPNAKCNVPLVIISAETDNKCQLIVKTNFDSIKSKKVLISVNGRNGAYRPQNIWPAMNIKKLDVWAFIEGTDTSKILPSFLQINGDTVAAVGCRSCTQQDILKLRMEFIASANAYGNDPSNVTLHSNFRSRLVSSNSLKVYLNNTLLPGGMAELENQMRVENGNSGARFCIVEASIKIDNCVFMEFGFKIKN